MSFLWQAGFKLLHALPLSILTSGLKYFMVVLSFVIDESEKQATRRTSNGVAKQKHILSLRTENWKFTFSTMYSVHYLPTGASSPEVPNFIHKMNKMRLSVLLEILERAVPGRASNLPAQLTCSSPCRSASLATPSVCSAHGSGPQQPSRSRTGGSALSDTITGTGKVGDSNFS